MNAPCSARRRIAFDKGRGFTTSQATLDFVRRTCRCDACFQLREAKGQKPKLEPQETTP